MRESTRTHTYNKIICTHLHACVDSLAPQRNTEQEQTQTQVHNLSTSKADLPAEVQMSLLRGLNLATTQARALDQQQACSWCRSQTGLAGARGSSGRREPKSAPPAGERGAAKIQGAEIQNQHCKCKTQTRILERFEMCTVPFYVRQLCKSHQAN